MPTNPLREIARSAYIAGANTDADYYTGTTQQFDAPAKPSPRHGLRAAKKHGHSYSRIIDGQLTQVFILKLWLTPPSAMTTATFPALTTIIAGPPPPPLPPLPATTTTWPDYITRITDAQ